MKWTLLVCALAGIGAPVALAQGPSSVPYERILAADQEPQNWLTYSRTYSGQRFSPLKHINSDNVNQLQVAWAYQMPEERTETSPLAIDGIIYLTAANYVVAIDGRTGRKIWEWRRRLPKNFRTIGFGPVNRGAAVLGDKLYIGSLDGRIVALNLKSGSEVWSSQVADWTKGYAITVAPLAAAGKVVIGISGGEAGIRGFVDAYDANSGTRIWRHYTVPAAGEPGVETWSGTSWKTGGGPTWVTGTFDPDTKTLYWGTGNPSPDWNGDVRKGDNLFTNSLLALDIDTGKQKWYFQFTPHDTHDWDSNHVPILFDAVIDGQSRKLVAEANRNAFYYVLDRTTGAFITAKSFAEQTWNDGFTADGRPKVRPGSEPTAEGNVVSPNYNGGTVWPSPSYSPITGLFYVSARDTAAKYFKRDTPYEEGQSFLGGGGELVPFEEHKSALRALEATTGALRWQFTTLTPSWAGILSTAGNVVFSGSDEGVFYSLDAKTGRLLWDVQLGGGVRSNAMTFAIDGSQYVGVAAGHVFYSFRLPAGTSVGRDQ